MKRARLIPVALLSSAVAGGLEASPNVKLFPEGTFCQKYGCTLVTSWSRFGRGYEIYHLTKDNKIELSIYRDIKGSPVGATYSTWTLDDWSGDYGRAAEFLRSVFPGAPIDKMLIARIDQSKTQAVDNVAWDGRILVLFRETARVPSFNQLLRVNVSAGIWQAGQP